MAEAKHTDDHEVIRQWVESRGGHPARVKGTGDGDDPGLLRIDFPGYSGEGRLEEIPWEDFFRKFDEMDLVFLYQDEPDSRFNKLVKRETAEQKSR
jgi:hypothetical protein